MLTLYTLCGQHFHPDHMSPSLKQKVELKILRHKLQILESDCGSSRAQGTNYVTFGYGILGSVNTHGRSLLRFIDLTNIGP